MDIKDAIYGRRSIRKYLPIKVSNDELLKIIEAGTWAPSACNIQGWHFIIIDDKSKFETLLKNGAAAFLKQVNQAILVLYDNQTDNTMYQDYIQSAAACIENMCLMAYSMGIGTCWVNFLPSKSKVRKIFNIPPELEPIGLVTLGYYSQKVNNRPRKYDTQSLISKNTFSSTVPVFKRKSKLKLVLKRVLRKIYFLIPCKEIVKPIINKKEKKFDN